MNKYTLFKIFQINFRFSLSVIIVLPALISCTVVIWLITYFTNENYDLPVQDALYGSFIVLIVSTVSGLLISYAVSNWLLDFEAHVANILDKKTSRFKLKDYSNCWIEEIYALARNLDEIDRKLRNYHESLNRSNKHLNLVQNAILEASNDAIISINENGFVKVWNKAAENLFGYNRKYAIHKCVSDLIVPKEFKEEHKQRIFDFFQKCTDSSVKEHTVVFRSANSKGKHATGYYIPIEITICKVSKHEVVAFIRDATEAIAKNEREAIYKERLEREICEKTYELQEANNRLEQAYNALKHAGEIATHSIYLASLRKGSNGTE